MTKDLQSFYKHDSEYNSESINSIGQNAHLFEQYKITNQFEKLGFDLALKLTSVMPNMHIDIGCGTGWLLNEMSDRFNQVIGIEPSKKAIEIATKLLGQKRNLDFINKDMVDGFTQIAPKEPVFITTSTVLNHIEDFYVESFLSGTVDELPDGSVLFFDERYDKNIQWNMWHVRSKDWWSTRLPNWQLVFLNIENSGYPSGIYGIRVGRTRVLKTHTPGTASRAVWNVSRIGHVIMRVLRKTLRVLKLKKS